MALNTDKWGKTFKRSSAAGIGADRTTAALLRGWAKSDPAAFEAMGGVKGVDNYIKEMAAGFYGGNAESGAPAVGLSESSQKIADMLSGMDLRTHGYAGMDDGRVRVLYGADGKPVYAGEAFSYKPAKDTLDTVLKGMAVIGAGAGLSSLAGGMGIGAAPGSLGGLDAVAAAEAASGGLGSLGANGAFLGEGIASGIPAWDTAVGLGKLGAGAAGGAGIAEGGGLINNAFADLAVNAGSLAPEGVGALIPSGAELGALGGGSLLAGGPLGGGIGNSGSSFLNNLIGKGSGGLSDQLKGLIPGSGSDWLKALLPALAGYASYKDAKKPQLTGYSGGIKPANVKQTVEQGKYGPISRTGFASGGEVGEPRYLNSPQDGMQDGIAAQIDGKQAAALSGGEFVIPADVVSHLGNGNSNAGAKQLYSMMERIRAERTGNPQQGKQIQPQRFLPR